MAECMKLFCWFNYGIIEIAHILGLTERKASNRTHEGLARLAIYYGYKKCITLSKDKELKIKDKKYLKWVASNPCIICQQNGCNAHHIQYAQHRGIGQKVGDQFTIPLCVKHHHQLHNCGMSERNFWEKIDIDPITNM